MPEHFGPANAWLYQERDQKFQALGEALGLDSDTCAELLEDRRAGDGG